MKRRTAKKGRVELGNKRTTEQGLEQSKELDTYEVNTIIKLMNQEDKTVAYAVEKVLPDIEMVICKVVDRMRNGGRLYYIGAGSSGRMGILDASECPPTFGVDADLVTGIIAGGDRAIRWAIEDAEDNKEAGKEDILQTITKEDIVIGITASGITPYVIGAIEAANEIGALTTGVSCNQHTLLSEVAQYKVEIQTGPEILTGSTRLKAGTAQKLVLNMITTTTMIKLGKVYGNQMVNMQATNEKLRIRAAEIVQNITNVSDKEAERMLNEAEGDTRVAILMIMYEVSSEEASAALKSANQHFRQAVDLLAGN